MSKLSNHKIKNYWNFYYKKELKIFTNSNFSRFVLKRLKRNKSLIDIGCGNGRDAFFFAGNKINTLGLDGSEKIININNFYLKEKKIKNLNFLLHDINSNKIINRKFNYIYVRFFVHAVTQKTELSLIKFIKKIKRKNSLVFFEFRNENDNIFKKGKKIKNNLFVFNKKHYRRKIFTKKFIDTFVKLTNSKLIYKKESNLFSITKYDKPNLCRLIFKF